MTEIRSLAFDTHEIMIVKIIRNHLRKMLTMGIVCIFTFSKGKVRIDWLFLQKQKKRLHRMNMQNCICVKAM